MRSSGRTDLAVNSVASPVALRTPRLLSALAMLLLMLTVGWTPAPQQGRVAVVGQVTNGTSGGTVPPDLPITIHVFSGMEETAAYTATLAADASFHLDDLIVEGGETFVARTAYQGVLYFSDPVTLEPGQQELSLPIAIYEVTDDATAVVVTQLHIFLGRAGDRLQVGEYYLISNAGDRTYVGVRDPETGQRVTLPLTLPEGAEGLHFEDAGLGERFLERGEGFVDTEPVVPGAATVEISFGYELPYREGQSVVRVFEVPVASVVLVPMEEDLALEGEGLTLVDSQDAEMWPSLSYAGGPLAAGEPLAFTVTRHMAGGQGGRGVEEQGGGEAGETAIGLVALAAAVVAVYLLWRSPAPGPLPAWARPLVEEIAALDADFEAGAVTEGAYRKKRKALKRRLRERLAEGRRG